MNATVANEVQRLVTELQRIGHGQYATQLGYLHKYLLAAGATKAILANLDAAEVGFDADAWLTDHVVNADQTCHDWPESEPQKLKTLWRIVRLLVETPEHQNPASWGQQFTYEDDLDQAAQAVTKHVVIPLLNFILSRLGTQSQILHLLQRCKRRVEWFDQEVLYDRYESDTTHGEDVYDDYLRRFLFDQGIEYPFSQARSPAGKADVIADLGTDDPLVCEVKLYDGASYGVRYLAQGLRQAVRYAHDHTKPVAHLVVFNLAEERLELPSDEKGPFPCIDVEGVRAFIVVVQAKRLPAASKDRKAEVRKVSREQLVTLVDETEEPGAAPAT